MNMRPRKNRLFRYLAPAFAVFGTLIGWSSPSDAYVKRIVIDQMAIVDYTPIPLGSSTPGASTSYTVYQGRIFGALDPHNPHNAIITDIDHAPTTSGKVDYIATFQIVTPTNPAQRSGLMIHEVPNRGGNAINTGSLIQGATYVQSGWQGDLLAQCSPSPAIPYPCFDLNSGPYGNLNTTTGIFTPPTVSDVVTGTKSLASYVVQVPVATTDGNAPNGSNTITGQVYSHVCTGTNGCGLAVGSTPTSTAQLEVQGPAFAPYHPASMDTNQAQFWTVSSQTFTGVDSAKTPIPTSQWAWAYCPGGWPGTPNPNWICLNGATFNPSLEYEMVYTAANPLVLGVGFAAFRDLASFLRYGSAAPGGGSNPIAGTVSKAYTVGASQSGEFLHGFIFYGFNDDERGRDNSGRDDKGPDHGGHDEGGRVVFDGAWPQIDGRMMVMNIRWGQPNNLMYLYMGGDEAPVWWADYPNLARNLPPDGMLHRCEESRTCPQILETFGSAELYSEKMSVALCGFTCVADIPLPSNVHRYYSPGATHGGGTVSFNWTSPTTVTIPTGQSLPNDPIPETFTNNALQYDFIQLLMKGMPMPTASPVYPTLASTTARAQHRRRPRDFRISLVCPYEGTQCLAPDCLQLRPRMRITIKRRECTDYPTTESSSRCLPAYAPQRECRTATTTAMVLPSVLCQAPLGTYTGWNLATTGRHGPNERDGPASVDQVSAGRATAEAIGPSGTHRRTAY